MLRRFFHSTRSECKIITSFCVTYLLDYSKDQFHGVLEMNSIGRYKVLCTTYHTCLTHSLRDVKLLTLAVRGQYIKNVSQS